MSGGLKQFCLGRGYVVARNRDSGSRFRLLLPAVLFLTCATSAHALTKQQALLALGEQVLKPSENAQEISAMMLPAPLLSAQVQPRSGGPPSISVASITGNPQWFAMVDLRPCAFFLHAVLYVFIDDVTGAASVFEAQDWPSIDGTQLGDSSLPGTSPILVFPLLPRPRSLVAGSGGPGPLADYGDAPDGQLAYQGVTARFPTQFATTNSSYGPGAHALVIGLERLGKTVSAEQDVTDPNDPDSLPNLADGDSDERMFLAWDPNTTPVTGHLIYDVTIAEGAPAVPRYVNVLFDLDRSGDWSGAATGDEWAVMNQVIQALPGTTTQISPPFDWGTASDVPTQVWMRAVLSRAPIDGSQFGAAGWDGSGAFAFGEVEDFEVYLSFCLPDITYARLLADPRFASLTSSSSQTAAAAAQPPRRPPPPICPNAVPPLPAPPPPVPGQPQQQPPMLPPQPPPLPPGPRIGCNGRQINYFALVVQGQDNPRQNSIQQAADRMEMLLTVQGYRVTRLMPNAQGMSRSSSQNMKDWMQNAVLPNVACEDKVLIYIIGHGGRVNGGFLYFRLNTNTPIDQYTGTELRVLLNMLPSCDGRPCNTRGTSCDVTVIVESCFSGNWLTSGRARGRRIIVSSNPSEVSQFGRSDQDHFSLFGGEFSNRYDRCARDRDVDDPTKNKRPNGEALANGDGNASPSEVFAWAEARIGQVPIWNGTRWVCMKVQQPSMSDMTCRCACPPPPPPAPR